MTRLYTLFATPAQTANFVMVAGLSAIESYLGAQVPRTFAASEVSFTINHAASTAVPRHLRVGHWMVVEGVRLPTAAEVASASNRPGDMAAVYAEENGVSYEQALVSCNMDGGAIMADARNDDAPLSKDERMTLEWLSKAQYSQYGECRGASLTRLLQIDAVDIDHEDHRGDDYRLVWVTPKGLELLQRS